MQRFTNLKVWQEGHALVLDVYRVTRRFPIDERFALVQQARRAAAAIPTNIAEGSKRKTNAQFAQFLNIAEASAAELEYLLMLSRDLAYAPPHEIDALLERTDRLARQLTRLRERVALEANP